MVSFPMVILLPNWEIIEHAYSLLMCNAYNLIIV